MDDLGPFRFELERQFRQFSQFVAQPVLQVRLAEEQEKPSSTGAEQLAAQRSGAQPALIKFIDSWVREWDRLSGS